MFYILIFSCNSENNDISSSLFNVNGLKSDIHIIEKQGYKRVLGVDSVIYTKKNNDTLIDLQFNIGKEPSVYSKTWKIKMKSNKINYAKNFILENNAIIITPICNYNEREYYFTAVDLKSNNTFLCKLLEENKSFYLYITYFNPNSR